MISFGNVKTVIKITSLMAWSVLHVIWKIAKIVLTLSLAIFVVLTTSCLKEIAMLGFKTVVFHMKTSLKILIWVEIILHALDVMMVSTQLLMEHAKLALQAAYIAQKKKIIAFHAGGTMSFRMENALIRTLKDARRLMMKMDQSAMNVGLLTAFP